MEKIIINGAITAMITPFNDEGGVDFEGLKQNTQFQIDNGISGLVPLGTTGESPTITDSEREQVIKTVVEIAKGKVPIIVGTGTNSTRATLEHTQRAKELGADAALIVNPYYNKPTQEGLYRHIRAVASRVDIPIVLYNIVGRTGVNIETSTMTRFKEIKNVIGVKEASGDINQMKAVISQMGPDFTVVSGDDNMTLDLMKEGGKGVISVVSNLLPRQVSDMCRHALEGNWAEAGKINEYLTPLYKAAFIETNPIPIKTAMNHVGRAAGPLRLPMCEMGSSNKQELIRVLSDMGVVQ